MKWFFLILLSLLLIAAITNPDERDHQGEVRGLVMELSGIDNRVFEGALWIGGKEFITSESYLVFSLTKFKSTTIGYGAFGKVIIFNKTILHGIF